MELIARWNSHEGAVVVNGTTGQPRIAHRGPETAPHGVQVFWPHGVQVFWPPGLADAAQAPAAVPCSPPTAIRRSGLDS